jgi:hypothetical protein
MHKIKISLFAGLNAQFKGFCLDLRFFFADALHFHGDNLPLPAGMEKPSCSRKKRRYVTDQSTTDKVIFDGKGKPAEVFWWQSADYDNHYKSDNCSWELSLAHRNNEDASQHVPEISRVLLGLWLLFSGFCHIFFPQKVSSAIDARERLNSKGQISIPNV